MEFYEQYIKGFWVDYVELKVDMMELKRFCTRPRNQQVCYSCPRDDICRSEGSDFGYISTDSSQPNHIIFDDPTDTNGERGEEKVGEQLVDEDEELDSNSHGGVRLFDDSTEESEDSECCKLVFCCCILFWRWSIVY